MEMLNALRNDTGPSDSQTFTASTSSIAVNALWFTSLTITLISALAGVLAKTWLVRFIPVTPGESSSEACERWIRDRRAEQWHLQAVITGIPLLIQLALILFLVGFALQSVGDNQGLGWSVLSLVVLAFIIYVIITVLPSLYPSCPFQTPISDLIFGSPAIYQADRRRKDQKDPSTRTATQWFRYCIGAAGTSFLQFWRDVSEMPKINDVQLDIWSWMLTESSRDASVNEAVVELTREDLNDKWWKAFIDCGVPTVLSDRLQELVNFGLKDGTPTALLGTYLHALLRFVDDIDRKVEIKLVTPHVSALLENGNPLHRWDAFPEELQALAFDVRTHLLVLCGSDHGNAEEGQKNWRTMLQKTAPNLRSTSVVAALRGLIEGKDNLRRVCAFRLAKYIETGTFLKIIMELELTEVKGTTETSIQELQLDLSQRESVYKVIGNLFQELGQGFPAEYEPELTEYVEKAWIFTFCERVSKRLRDNTGPSRVAGLQALTQFAERGWSSAISTHGNG